MTAFISLKKEEFAPNEDILISYVIDNSQCSSEIKSQKVKLHREITIFKESGKKAPIFSKNEYIEEIKQPIYVKQRTKQERQAFYRVPAYDRPERYGELE